MRLVDWLMGRPRYESRPERAEDQRALEELHRSFTKVQRRTVHLEAEVLRVNEQLRIKLRRESHD